MKVIRFILGLLVVFSVMLLSIVSLQSSRVPPVMAQAPYRYAYLLVQYGDDTSTALKFVDPAHPDEPAEIAHYILPDGWGPPLRGYYPNLVSPDGKWIAFVLLSTDQKRLSVQLYSLRSGEQKQIAEGFLTSGQGNSMLWSPDSRYLALDVGQHPDDIELAVYSLIEQQLMNLSQDELDQRDIDWSTDAAYIATFTEPGRPCVRNAPCFSALTVFDVPGEALVNSIDLSAVDLNGNQACLPTISPDHHYVAFVSNCYRDVNLLGLSSEVYIWDLLENDLKRITDFSSQWAGKFFRITYRLNWLDTASLLIGVAPVVAGEPQQQQMVVYHPANDVTTLRFNQGGASFIENPRTHQLVLRNYTPFADYVYPIEFEQIRMVDVISLVSNSPSPGLKIPAGCRFDWSPDGNLLAYTTSPRGDCGEKIDGVNFIDFTTGAILEHHLSKDDNAEPNYILPIGWAAGS